MHFSDKISPFGSFWRSCLQPGSWVKWVFWASNDLTIYDVYHLFVGHANLHPCCGTGTESKLMNHIEAPFWAWNHHEMFLWQGSLPCKMDRDSKRSSQMRTKRTKPKAKSRPLAWDGPHTGFQKMSLLVFWVQLTQLGFQAPRERERERLISSFLMGFLMIYIYIYEPGSGFPVPPPPMVWSPRPMPRGRGQGLHYHFYHCYYYYYSYYSDYS